MKLWTGETVSLFGTRMGDVAISFAAVIALKATPFQMGILAAARNRADSRARPVRRRVVDRMRRRPILIGTDIGRFIVLGTIPIAAMFAALTMVQLCAVMLAYSALDLFFDVAYRSYLPSLVEREDLLDANSKLTASASVAEAGGFALSGWLVEWLTAPFAILIDAISFLASAIAIALIGKAEPAPAPRARDASVAREIADGARLVFSDGRLRAFGINRYRRRIREQPGLARCTCSTSSTRSASAPAFSASSSPSAARARCSARSPRAAPPTLSAPAWRWSRDSQSKASRYMLLPIARGAGPVSVALLVAQQLIGDSAATVYFINAVSLIQTITPKPMLGRVNASLRFVRLGSVLVGPARRGTRGRNHWAARDDRDRRGGFVGHSRAARLFRSRIAHRDGRACRAVRRRLSEIEERMHDLRR